MKIDIVENISLFQQIHRNWNRIYLADQESHAFLSWPWLSEYLSIRERWFILAWKRKRTGKFYDAFLPLEVATYQDEHTGLFCDDILMIGNHGTGRTGFLCIPGLEQEAAGAFAGIIAAENWTSLRFDRCGAGSARLDDLLSAFPDGPFARIDEPDEGRRFAACGRPIHSVLVRSRTGRNLRDSLNRRSVDVVFERATALHAQGKLEWAEAGYRQIIRTAPRHVQARCGLARLCNDKGEHSEAEYLYRTLLTAVPDSDEILYRLGDTQIARACYREASKTFEELVVRHPHRGILRYKLAIALLAAGRKDAAIAILQSFDHIFSDDTEHMRCKLRAQQILPRLKNVAYAEEDEAGGDAEQQPISFESTDGWFDRQFRLMTATPLLLTPSLPRGASAHLHAKPQSFGRKGSKLKH